MSGRSSLPIKIPPGVVKGAGALEARGRWTDAQWMRFKSGRPTKMGGWDKLSSAQVSGIARRGHAWSNLSDRTVTAVGTQRKLYTINTHNELVDITPFDTSFYLGAAFSTATGTPTVTVHHEAHGKLVGQSFTITEATAAVGGLTMNGTWTIASVPSANTFTFTHSSNATATEGPTAFACIDYPYALTNAFTTSAGSATVTVAHPAHGKVAGQVVVFTGAATVGGLAMTGTWTIASVPSANTFTFTHSSNATGTAGPTGSATAQYEMAPGEVDPYGADGYGIGDYGEEDYGMPRGSTGVYFAPHIWSLTHFGRQLLGHFYKGFLHTWDPTANPTPRARRVAGAPMGLGSFVTPERFVFTYGASETTTGAYDPMLVRWCSQANFTVWTPATTNTANARRLTEGKEIIGGGPAGEGLSLIWTDTAAYTFRYTGSRFVYESRLAASNAGLIGPAAWCEAQGRAFWFGSGQFWAYGAGVVRLPNQDDFLEWLTARLRPLYGTKTVCFYNQPHNEVWWIFVTGEETEPCCYAAHNLADGSWTLGELERTAAWTPAVAGDTRPTLMGADGYIYLHERGTDGSGLAIACRIESGPVQLAEGETLLSVVGFIPDFSAQEGTVTATLMGADRGGTGTSVSDALAVPEGAGLVDARIRARLMKIRLEQSVVGGTFALGQPAVQIRAGGKKR